MDESDIEEFDKFVERNWGIKPHRENDEKEPEAVMTSENQPKKRGRKPKNAI